MVKRKLSQTQIQKSAKPDEIELPATISSDEPIPKRTRWINRQRVLVFCSRGSSYRSRHLMTDLRNMMAHSRAESKMDKKDKIILINEMCTMRHCNKCVYFESKRNDLYMWITNIEDGPSAKFLVQNVHTMAELKLTGNCLKTSRPLLSFDRVFDEAPHWKLLKELFIQVFGVPNQHPKSQPFVDHVMTFSVVDDRIWFRNYQILEEDGALAEIGPRFVLNPIRIFKKSFGGETLYENPVYIKPRVHRMLLKKAASCKYSKKMEFKMGQIARQEERQPWVTDTTDSVFETPVPGEGDGDSSKAVVVKAQRRRAQRARTR